MKTTRIIERRCEICGDRIVVADRRPGPAIVSIDSIDSIDFVLHVMHHVNNLQAAWAEHTIICRGSGKETKP